jgi:hypothetical protein
VEVTTKANHDRAGSLRAATLSSKEQEGIIVEKHKLEVKGDGSDAATAAVIYIRWLISDNNVDVGLVACKTRITCFGPGSTVIVEMNGATLSMRLLRVVVRALQMAVQKATYKTEYCTREPPDKVVATRRREEMEEIERIVGLPPIPGEQVLLLFQDIDVVYGQDQMEDKIKSFWDDGSTS